MTDLLVPPKVELKFPQVNFMKLVYPRLKNKVLEVKQRDLLFSLVHGIYRNRARLFRQNRVEDNLCPHPACKRENLTQDIEHLFCTCYKVRAAWDWTRLRMVEILSDQGRPPDTNNLELILLMYPSCRMEGECSFLLGTYLEQVHNEVMLKDKELLVNTLKGVLRSKLVQNRNKAVPDVFIPQNWL